MLLNDKEIIDLCNGYKPLITPFSSDLVRQVADKKIISYGVSSYGYDLRAGDEYKVFTNVSCKEIDPKNIDEDTFVTVKKDKDYILIPPNGFILTYSQEYLCIPRNVTGVVLGKSTYARAGIVCICTPLEAGWCFTGDTEVALANGTSVSFKDMVDRYSKGERFFGYTFGKDGTVEIAELLNPRKTRENAELVEVTLDNDEVIRCTPDHKFLTKENIYVEAKNLREGTSLMPLYRYVDKKGYESVASPIYGIPNNHKVVSVKPLTIKEEVYCLTVPETHNFALDAGVFVHNCGHVTLEFANTTSLPVRFYPGEGCCQVLFLTGNECGVSYADRGGKYMNQGKEVVLPKV